MSLTGKQYEQIQQALLAAFDEQGLQRLCKIELDIALAQITLAGDLTQRAFDLVKWADDQGRVAELIEGALRQAPRNATVQALVQEATTWHLAAPAPAAASPYKGLAFFDVADAPLFFGRETLTAELVEYLKGHRFLAVVGASGSGKSSVVRAGVAAELQQGAIQGSDKWWTPPIITPTAHPLKALAASLTHASESVAANMGVATWRYPRLL